MEINPNDRVEAVWCVDSETGREFLIDLITSKKLAERVKGKMVEVQNDVPNS